jgi:O-antigen ligase
MPTLEGYLRRGVTAARRHWRALLGVVLGAYLASLTAHLSIGDRPAPPAWSIVAALVVFGALVFGRRVPVLLALVFAAFAASLTFSVAHGPSLAMVTWWPVFVAVFLVGRFFPAALYGFTLVLFVNNAGALVILGAMNSTTVTSGSTQYFMGMVGAMALPFWFALAMRGHGASAGRYATILGLAVSGLAVWTVLVANSRASLLALSLVVLGAVLAAGFRWYRRHYALRPLALRVLVVIALVPVYDLGLGLWFGDGSSTVLNVLPQRTADTVAEVARVETGPLGMRLALWRQAAVMVPARPQGHGPGSYGHVIHAYQVEPMLWSASPHNVWALVAVETGVAGLLALALLAGVGFLLAARERRPAALALLGATVVMSLDVFDIMPPNALAWWLVLGAVWSVGLPTAPGRWWDAAAAVVLAGVAVLGIVAAARLALPCDDGCDAMARYAGHPRFVGESVEAMARSGSYEESVWGVTYPWSFWTRDAFVRAQTDDETVVASTLLPYFPLRSPVWYLSAAESESDVDRAAAIAGCGLRVFYGDQFVWLTGRLSGAALAEIGERLREIAGEPQGSEAACEVAGISTVPLALR